MTGKIFFKENSFKEPERACGDITVNSSFPSSLKVATAMAEVEPRGPISCQVFCFEDLRRTDSIGSLHDEYKNANIRVAPTFLPLCGGDRVGWGVFDEHDLPRGPVFRLRLLKQKVWEGYAVSAGQCFYWVLLLQRGEVPDTFVRVGWGMILKVSWLDGAGEHDVCLVWV